MTSVARARSARAAEIPQVIGLVDAAMRAGTDQTMLHDYPLVYAADNLPNVQVVEVDGRIVATSPVLPKRVRAEGGAFGMGVISPTATDPPHQHHGYGAACVAGCVERMAVLDLEISVLWTLVATFPFYEGNGWQAVQRYGGTWTLRHADAEAFAGVAGNRASSRVTTLAAEPDRLDDVRALRGDRAGVERSRDESAALLALPKMTTWLAVGADGRTEAFLVDSHAVNKPGLIESGGPPPDVAGLVAHALGRLAADATVDVPSGFAPDPLDAVVATALPDARSTQTSSNLMVRVNAPGAFVRAIRGWLVQHVPRDMDPVSIGVTDASEIIAIERRPFGLAIGPRRHPRHVDLTRRELASILFGAHPDRPVAVPPELAWLPPLHLPIAILDRS